MSWVISFFIVGICLYATFFVMGLFVSLFKAIKNRIHPVPSEREQRQQHYKKIYDYYKAREKEKKEEGDADLKKKDPKEELCYAAMNSPWKLFVLKEPWCKSLFAQIETWHGKNYTPICSIKEVDGISKILGVVTEASNQRIKKIVSQEDGDLELETESAILTITDPSGSVRVCTGKADKTFLKPLNTEGVVMELKVQTGGIYFEDSVFEFNREIKVLDIKHISNAPNLFYKVQKSQGI